MPASPVTRLLAPYACDPRRSRGRRFDEPESPGRSAFQRDRDRIVHARAFRRLMHKTQVFVNTEGDHYRTRLTHSLEVAQVARSVCRALGLDEDLAEAVALAHDLGHTPFGHAGEQALDAVAAPFGGFDHNVQTLRILTELETPYAAFDGLNLTWETLEGVAKHNGPVAGDGPPFVAAYCRRHGVALDTWPAAEAQVASIADDIAYHGHDVDDGLRAGLFALEDLSGVPLAARAAGEARERHPEAPRERLVHETVRRIIDRLVRDLVEESRARLSGAASLEDLRRRSRPAIGFSPPVAEANRALKSWLLGNMYQHGKVAAPCREAATVVRDLFARYREAPALLPRPWRARLEGCDNMRGARVVADYIAGMTDRYAMDEHARIMTPP